MGWRSESFQYVSSNFQTMLFKIPVKSDRALTVADKSVMM
jgi:hypothetical protein